MLKEMNVMTELADLILETLKQRGDWMSRRDIAKAIKRPGQLTPYDKQLLNDLVASGKVEAAQRPSGPVRLTWMYRSIAGKE